MNQDLINSQQNPRRGIPPGYKGTHFKNNSNLHNNITFLKPETVSSRLGLDNILHKVHLPEMKEDDLLLIGLMLLMLTEQSDDCNLMLLVLAIIYFS